MSKIERTNEKYNRAITKEILRADKMPPEKRTSDIKELLKYLNGLDESTFPSTDGEDK